MKKRETTIMSTWKKGKYTCTVCSKKETEKGAIKIWFAGYNPFPCYSMQSTYHVVANWMVENGWEKQTNGMIIYTITETDDETGKVINRATYTNHFVPVKEVVQKVEYIRTTEIEKSIPELLKEGKKISAVKLYYKAMGVSLKEAVAAIDTMKAQMGL